MHQPRVGELKIRLGELGFDEQASEFHIDLGVVAATIG
jgi:hypothetical protein